MKITTKKTFIYSVGTVLVAGIALGAYFLYASKQAPAYTYAEVKKGNLIEAVSANGNVKPAQDVDLAFQSSGKVATSDFKVGNQVKAGQVLARLSSADLAAQVNSASAAYDIQVAKLADLKNGASSADLQVSQTAVDNAQKNLADTQDKTLNDLASVYNKSADILNDAYAKAFDAVYNKTDGLYDNYSSNPSFNILFTNSSLESEVKTSIPAVNDELTQLKNEISSMGTEQSAIDAVLARALIHLDKAREFLVNLNNLLNYAVASASTPESQVLIYKNNINGGLASMNLAISETKSQQNAIAAQKISNQTQLTLAQNSLASAQKALNLKMAGATSEQITAQTAAVAQALATLENYRAQLAKSTIISPIDGILSRQDTKVGEIVSMNVSVITVMSNAKYQIETFVAESYIDRIKNGEEAKVTLDADNNQKQFDAKVITVDPGQTAVKGSPAYKVTLEFSQDDSLIKDGMSANVKIIISEKDGVLLVPASSVLKKYNDNIVLVENGADKPVEKTVTVGATQDGQTEILSGLNEGERVVTFGTNK